MQLTWLGLALLVIGTASLVVQRRNPLWQGYRIWKRMPDMPRHEEKFRNEGGVGFNFFLGQLAFILGWVFLLIGLANSGS